MDNERKLADFSTGAGSVSLPVLKAHGGAWESPRPTASERQRQDEACLVTTPDASIHIGTKSHLDALPADPGADSALELRLCPKEERGESHVGLDARPAHVMVPTTSGNAGVLPHRRPVQRAGCLVRSEIECPDDGIVGLPNRTCSWSSPVGVAERCSLRRQPYGCGVCARRSWRAVKLPNQTRAYRIR